MPALIVTLVAAGIMLLLIVFVVIWRIRYKKQFSWTYHGKTLLLQASAGRAQLFVDGALSDEFAGSVRVCVLKVFLEGTEVRVRVQFGWKILAEATAGGVALQLM